MNDGIDQFRDAIAASGMTPPDTIIDDGAIHRFSTNGKPSDTAGWYIMHNDGIRAGSFGNWRDGFTQTWCSKSEHVMSEAERQRHRARVQAMQEQRETDQMQRQRDAAAEAAQRVNHAEPCTQHEYLSRKGIQPHGAKIEGRNLLVAMRDTSGVVHSLQTISPKGEKFFLSGGRVRGCYFSIGQPVNGIIVCEGFATGASIREATGEAVAVAFNAGNLGDVATAFRTKYPALKIVVAADDDHLTTGNPGMTKARAAAVGIGGYLAVPIFDGSRPDKATDFNDLHQHSGLTAVKACIDAAELVPVQATASNKTEVLLLNGAELTPEPIRWLWPDWLALGKLHILAGAPGQGKTTIALACAATVTVGGRWPDGSRSVQGNILIWSGEDDPSDTLLPRLIASGADKSRCYFVKGTRIYGEEQPFDPARDIAALESQAQRIGGVKLLIVDPVVSAVAGDSHKNSEVRRALQPLVDLASRLDAAVIGVSHFSKGGVNGDPASRVVGSIAFTAVARVVLVAAKVKNEEGEEKRILARGKSNIGPDTGGFEYHIEQGEPIPGIQASYVAWGKPVEGTARELLAEPEDSKDSESERSAQSEAEEFLIQLLRDGPSPTKHVEAEAKAAGISWRTVRRASDALGIKKRKLQGAWYWEKPNLSMQLVQDVQHLDVGQVGQLDGQHALEASKAPETIADESEVF